ncbi:hypothetical protein CWB41_05760 [Methylovirgula ligni]|uniref:Aspartyl protease n=2 Tax=Methylovirgula ligni TaxID=569860 RepID=A0A3D9Z3N0_9HYPH|nr:hypothetical protein CWB41_05760 [Methylovirgula ligni]REF89395.1 hypothetical protein DES32_0616 [Methylovirgula ligni]
MTVAHHKIFAATILLALALAAAMFHFRATPQTTAMLCSAKTYPLSHSAGAPHIEIDIDGTPARALLDYGATQSSLRAKAATDVGLLVKAATSLPLPGESEFLARHADPATDAIIGTDLLAHLTVALNATTAAISATPCAASQLQEAGFTPIDQRGFFSPGRVHVAHDRPNVPVVFLRIGAAKTWAQIDTGYDDDLYPHSLDINQAFHDALIADGASLTLQNHVTVKTCAGFESRPVYSSRQPLVITNESGAAVAQTRDYYLIVKPANICGGIAAQTTPAAQLGVSFLRLFQTIVFDPQAGRVWIKKD